MGHVLRPVSYRSREDGRSGRLRWLLAITALNLVLWSGVIVVLARIS